MAVLVNKSKRSLFTVEERIGMLEEVTGVFPNVTIGSFHGLLVDYCRDHDIRAIVKGLRAITDFDYELQMAQMNQRLSGVDTLFMSTSRSTASSARWSRRSPRTAATWPTCCPSSSTGA